MAEGEGRVMILRRLFNRLRRRKRPMTLEEWREYQDQQFHDRLRRVDPLP